MARGLFLAVEELKEAEKKEKKEATAVAAPAADSAETEIIESNKEGVDLDQDIDTVETASDDIDTLDDIAEVIEESAENGGMTPDAAKMAEVAVESIMRRHGMSIVNKPIPSMESFSRASSRVSATNLSLESVRDKASEMLNQLIEFIKNIGNKIVSFFKTIFLTAIPKLQQRLEALTSEVESGNFIPGETKGGSFIKSLHYNNETTPAAILKGISATSNAMSTMAISLRGSVSMCDDVVEFANEAESKNEAVVNGAFSVMVNLGEIIDAYKWGEENGYYYSPLLSGDRKICIGSMKNNPAKATRRTLDMLSSMGEDEKKSAFFKVIGKEFKANIVNNKNALKGFAVRTFKNATFKVPETVQKLSKQESKAALDAIGSLLRDLDNSKKLVKDTENALSRMRSAMDKAKRLVKMEDTRSEKEKSYDEAKNFGFVLRQITKSTIGILSSSLSKFGSVAISTSKAAMDYVEVSIDKAKDVEAK